MMSRLCNPYPFIRVTMSCYGYALVAVIMLYHRGVNSLRNRRVFDNNARRKLCNAKERAWHPTYSEGWSGGYCRYTADCDSPVSPCLYAWYKVICVIICDSLSIIISYHQLSTIGIFVSTGMLRTGILAPEFRPVPESNRWLLWQSRCSVLSQLCWELVRVSTEGGTIVK